MVTKKITFTTKIKNKPQGNFMSMDFDPVFLDIEETNFPTQQGDKKVRRICFFPSESISQAEIKNVLQIVDEEAKSLTFEIMIDGAKIEAKEEPPQAGKFASSSASASPANESPKMEANKWQSGRLDLRKFKLTDLKVKTSSDESDQGQNDEGATNGTDNQQNRPQAGQENSGEGNSGTGSRNNSSDQTNTAKNNQNTEETTSQPTAEEINNSSENLKNSTESGDKEELATSIKKNQELRDKGAKESAENQVAEQAARKKLAEDWKKYRQTILEATENKLENNGVQAEELDNEATTELAKLKNKQIIEPTEVDEAEKKIVKNIYQKAVVKKITNLEKKVQQAIKNQNKQEMAEAKRKLTQFINNSNYQTKKSAAETLLKKLEVALKQNNNSEGNIPWKVVVSVSLAVVVLVGAIAYARKRIKN